MKGAWVPKMFIYAIQMLVEAFVKILALAEIIKRTFSTKNKIDLIYSFTRVITNNFIQNTINFELVTLIKESIVRTYFAR